VNDTPLAAVGKYILLQNARPESTLMIARIDNFPYVFVIRRVSVNLKMEPAPWSNIVLFEEI